MLRRVFLGAILAAAAHASPNTNVTSDTLWDWRTAANPQISRDGKVVVYVLGWNDQMVGRFRSAHSYDILFKMKRSQIRKSHRSDQLDLNG